MNIYSSRIKKVQDYINQSGSDGFFISKSAHIFYLSGFKGLSPEEMEASLFIDQKSVYLYLPKMYQEQGNNLDSVKEKIVTCILDYERDGLLSIWLKTSGKGKNILIEEGDLTIAEYNYLKKESEGTFQTSNGFLESLRVIKDAEELNKIREVVSRTDLVFNDLIAGLKSQDYPQLTELDVADLLRVLGRKHGLLAFSFEPIVASGAGGSEPHYVTSNKKLQKGEALLMDFGFTLDGYHSDLTRTIFLGKATDTFKKMYEVVLECNKQSLKSTKPGIDAGSLHKKAVTFFKKHRLDQFFIHGLGHGVGLEVHEEPFFRLHRKTPLQTGMAVTIEPGLYFPNEFGIRIEDYVIVTEKGCDVLSKGSTKELIELS